MQFVVAAQPPSSLQTHRLRAGLAHPVKEARPAQTSVASESSTSRATGAAVAELSAALLSCSIVALSARPQRSSRKRHGLRLSRASTVSRKALSADELKVLEDGASEGDGEAAFLLGQALLEGDGVAANPGKAADWFAKAGEAGVVKAQYNLGMMLCEGELVPLDKEAGAAWLAKAASGAEGDPFAMYFLGSLLMQGDGIEQDADLALQYLRRAAEAGLVDAQYAIGRILMATPEEAFEQKAWAAHWLTKAAEQGSVPALYDIGMLFFHGVGRPADEEKAAQWISDAAGKGHAPAQYMMGSMLLSGTGVEENKQWAAYWFEEAAKQGHVDAQYNLGLMLEGGDGVPEDKEKAEYWLNLAAKQGDEEAAKVSEEVSS
mmetsp:Transcript_45591/g.108462  ORF Transcript_45591/g.108462 Transcript_45591/m.108462 type:complete len:376 (-) Transcript_45591:119-1246(-)